MDMKTGFAFAGPPACRHSEKHVSASGDVAQINSPDDFKATWVALAAETGDAGHRPGNSGAARLSCAPQRFRGGMTHAMGARLLVFDTSTEFMSLALSVPGGVFTREGPGGAQASARLIPDVMALLAEAYCSLAELDAIAFGRGPGAFTGLRTACSVAQGLALGADKPVLPVDSLMAVAQDAADLAHAQAKVASGTSVWVVMDARMNEIYAAHYLREGPAWRALAGPMLTTPQALNALWLEAAPSVVAGSALAAFGEQLQPAARGQAVRCFPQALPRARAMLPLAQGLWAAGAAIDAALALPFYVRDKVAQTTSERDAARAAREGAGAAP
jgi:tRNA threonylcarbamoyladenosine biosynthesis protein TsaB